MIAPDIEINLIICTTLENEEVIVIRRCGQREKGVVSSEVCKEPVDIKKTSSCMMIFIVRDTVCYFIHFA